MGPYGWEPFQIEFSCSKAPPVFYGPISPSLRTPSVNPRPQEFDFAGAPGRKIIGEADPFVIPNLLFQDVLSTSSCWACLKPLEASFGLLHFAAFRFICFFLGWAAGHPPGGPLMRPSTPCADHHSGGICGDDPEQDGCHRRFRGRQGAQQF